MKKVKVTIKKFKNGAITATSTGDLREYLKAMGYVMKPTEEDKQPNNG